MPQAPFPTQPALGVVCEPPPEEEPPPLEAFTVAVVKNAAKDMAQHATKSLNNLLIE